MPTLDTPRPAAAPHGACCMCWRRRISATGTRTSSTRSASRSRWLASIALTSGVNIPHGVWASVTLLVVIGGLAASRQHPQESRRARARHAARRGARAVADHRAGYRRLALADLSADVGDRRRLRLLRDRQGGLCRAADGDHDGDRLGPRRPADRRRPVAHGERADRHRDRARAFRSCCRNTRRIRGATASPTTCANARGSTPRSSKASRWTRRQLTQRFLVMSQRLVQSRSLMESVAKEIDVPVSMLEEIQRLHRSILAALEMMATSGAESARMLAAEPQRRGARRAADLAADGAGAALRARRLAARGGVCAGGQAAVSTSRSRRPTCRACTGSRCDSRNR